MPFDVLTAEYPIGVYVMLNQQKNAVYGLQPATINHKGLVGAGGCLT